MRRLKNLLFALLCLAAFGAATFISFLGSANHLTQTNLTPIQVDWDDSVGYVLPDLSYGNGEKNTYDLYIPAEMPQGQPCSLILLIHGGGHSGR